MNPRRLHKEAISSSDGRLVAGVDIQKTPSLLRVRDPAGRFHPHSDLVGGQPSQHLNQGVLTFSATRLILTLRAACHADKHGFIVTDNSGNSKMTTLNWVCYT